MTCPSSYSGGCRCDYCRETQRLRIAESRARRRRLTLGGHNTTWKADAACRTTPTAVFFDPELEADAVAICQTCPVADACLDYAAAWNLEDGVYGGKTEKQRRKLKKSQAA